MNPLTLAANLIASNQTVAELLELNEELEDEIERLLDGKDEDAAELKASIELNREYRERIEKLAWLVAVCPLMATTTQNAAELAWIKRANAALLDPQKTEETTRGPETCDHGIHFSKHCPKCQSPHRETQSPRRG